MVITTEPSLKHTFPMETRGCRFPDEIPDDDFSMTFRQYTKNSCEFLCIIKKVGEQLGCLPPYIPVVVRYDKEICQNIVLLHE